MRNGKTIWHCRRTSPPEVDIITYDSPVPYVLRPRFLTLQPASGYTDALAYGIKVDKTWIMIANESFFSGVFNEGDVLYVDGNSPSMCSSGYVNGAGANAIITSVREQNLAIRIVLEKQEL